MTLFINSFQKLMKWYFTIIYISIMSIVSIVLGFVLKYEIYEKQLSTQTQLSSTIGIYYILIFMWVLGIPFLIMMTSKGISLLANEFQEGTMSLLVSTKISRTKIVLSKWLALYITTLLLGTLAIILNLSIIYFVSGMSSFILNQLIQAIPNLIYYLLFIGFIFTTLSILMSLLVKSKVLASITMITIIILIFLIIPLFKSFLTVYYEDYYLYLFDLNYQLGLIYNYFISKSNIELTPSIQNILGMFIGIFDLDTMVDLDLLAISDTALLSKASVRNYLNVRDLLLGWSFTGFMSLILSIIILQKKDVI
ncbi:MAG: family transporter protein [Haloplasmataceae bacterium]|nr:family transporter protein [Haloplasmataceae bacterium]